MRVLVLLLITGPFLLPGPVVADDGLVGDWQLRVEGRRGVQTPVLTVNEEEGSFSGRIGGARGQVEIPEVAVDGQSFQFPFAMTTPMGEFKLLYKGTRDGDKLTGTVDTPRGQIPFSGVRKAAE